MVAILEVRPAVHGPIIAAAAIAIAACTTTRPTDRDARYELPDRVTQITLENGVDKTEANTIAEWYWTFYYPGWGVLDVVHDGGDVWIAPTHVGVAAAPGSDIRVSKKS